MLYYGSDPFFILIIITLGLSLLAQWKVQSTYNHFAKVAAGRGLPAEEVARQILSHYGVNIPINQIGGNLTDHYDPRRKTLALSQGVYGSRSIAAYGIAAHEAGHAIQHALGYSPLRFRNWFYPAAAFGSNLGPWLFIIGLFMGLPYLTDAGIIFFAFAVIFSMVTLPVEFNASGRAIAALRSNAYLSSQELQGAQKVLSAAALTYVAATLMAVLQFARLLFLRNERRR
ncbi:neutral zinc metallopeptidase family protein [Candidatus Termititenax persephonae]|uniref:Neutral zinc metallopeptidase family protein n=1 Tax=Candidatus Termititenax persephonae TaxID=2218525 RepID=A0A388TGJ4_9BACT|nr:neutral zinc metallopeptidase family protein [Candidatus Termititenax persephonae]